MFTKQHFEQVAETLRKIENIDERIKQAYQWIDIFKKSNDIFDEDKFLEACELS